MSAAPHIVCFAPFADWTLHSAREMTLVQALKLRGCTATVVLCDGVFSDCDLHRPVTDGPWQRSAQACLLCQAGAAGHRAKWGVPFRWLGRWLDEGDFEAAARWVGDLRPEEYADAVYGDWSIGAWARASVHAHVQQHVLDMELPHVATAYASYLNSTLLASFGLSRLYEAERPALQITMNGSMAVTRAALELARMREIRTVCEERSYLREGMCLFDNVSCLDHSQLNALWRAWETVPLTPDEIDRLTTILRQRRAGGAAETDPATLVKRLALDAKRPIWALFTSCTDERITDPASRDAFESQEAWIEATVAYVAMRPDLQLVIRVHPNTGDLRPIRSKPQGPAYFEGLAQRLPPNARLVDSRSDVSSSDLAAAADLGLMWCTTMGLEMATMGRPVLRAGGGWCAKKSFLHHADQPDGYHALLDRLGPRPQMAPAEIIAAWRFAACFFWRQSHDFPLVTVTDSAQGGMAYDSPQALAPGREPNLDRICEALLSGEPLLPMPEPRDPQLAVSERRAVLARVSAMIA